MLSPRAVLLLALLALGLPSSTAAELRFREVSADWGLAFEHHNGARGGYYQPETNGSGVVLFDYDLDGDADSLFVDSGALPDGSDAAATRLYRNDGDGRFVDVTARTGIVFAAYGMGATAGDIDGDGDLDLYLTGVGANRLFINRGDGSFHDATAAAGVGDERWSSSAAFGDVDRDGHLDLYVANYLVWSLADDRGGCEGAGTGLTTYCHPALLEGDNDILYRNQGDGTFADATAAAGLGDAAGKGLGVVFGDFDGDRWPDLYVANDTTPNFFFRNRGDGTFEDLSLLSGTALSDRTEPEAGMGIAVGDVSGDGRDDIYVTNYALETNALYRNQGSGLFADGRHLAGLAEPSIPALGFGTAFADFDLDGDLDLAVANGHVIDVIERLRPGLTWAQRNQIFEQVTPGRFAEVEASGLDVVRVSRGLATGDLDGDGDPDLVISNSNGAAEVYENLAPPAAWLAVDLDAGGGNRFGIGARVAVSAGDHTQAAEVRTASSYLSQSDLTLLFGLGGADMARVEVVGADGGRWRFLDLPPSRRLRLSLGNGVAAAAGRRLDGSRSR